MSDQINFKVNGREISIALDWNKKLLDILRDDLNLTGTKRGCDSGVCGACTVIVNKKAVKSCVFSAKKLEGAEVLTIEGLTAKQIKPIQTALVESGAVQCGFCTPGIVMELFALFTANPDCTDEELLKKLDKHLCRCTGYEAIIDGAMAARLNFQRKTASV